MENRIIEICELGQPQSIIQREGNPISELIKTDSLIKELNEQLRLHSVGVSFSAKDMENFAAKCMLTQPKGKTTKELLKEFCDNDR